MIGEFLRTSGVQISCTVRQLRQKNTPFFQVNCLANAREPEIGFFRKQSTELGIRALFTVKRERLSCVTLPDGTYTDDQIEFFFHIE